MVRQRRSTNTLLDAIAISYDLDPVSPTSTAVSSATLASPFNPQFAHVFPASPLRPTPSSVMRSVRTSSFADAIRWLRHRPLLAISSLIALTLILWLSSTHSHFRSKHVSDFHLLVPASSSNSHLCRLLASALVLNYPPPVLINWDAIETGDVYDMHMSKIDQTLAYLEAFPPERDNDLALMVDGYDIWFQLPPETLIQRYFEATNKLDERIRRKLGSGSMRTHDLRHTVLFGPDKMCWPKESDGAGRLACWTVPESTLPRNIYGPLEDVVLDTAYGDPYHARPMWLNSGTIMGPIADLRAVFEAVAARVRAQRHGSSDQFYFAEIWGEQEYVRRRLDPHATYPSDARLPHIDELGGADNRTEYHIGIDYESALFLNVGYTDPFLSWLKYDKVSRKKQESPHTGLIEQLGERDNRLPEDIASTYAPLSSMEGSAAEQAKSLTDAQLAQLNHPKTVHLKGWHDIYLLTNLISRRVAPIVHFTFEKEYRIKWWDRMWFVPFVTQLFEAASTQRLKIDVSATGRKFNATLWRNSHRPVTGYHLHEDGAGFAQGQQRSGAGAWSDKGTWLSWKDICGTHDEMVFGTNRQKD